MYLVDKTGKQVVSYDHDPYGKIIGTNDYSTQTFAQIPTEPEDTTKTIAELNPLRYRGYYYDTDDLGFYYLQSRYYDADTCRFISADEYTDTDTGYLGYNMFAYCNNNPILASDPDGRWFHLVIGAVVGAAVGALSAAIQGKSGAEIAVAAVAGGASGLLTASGAGMAAQVIGGALISAGESYFSQGVSKGFDKIDRGEIIGDAVIGGISGLTGGIGKDTHNHLMKQWGNVVKRVGNKLTHDGLKAVGREAIKAGKYYFSQTAKVFYKPLIKGAAKSLMQVTRDAIINSFIISVS